MIALTAARLFTPPDIVEQPLVLVDDSVIVEVGSRSSRETPRGCRVVDFGDAVLAPGFIDMHIHGAAGHDVMESSPEALSGIGQFLASHGVSGYFPTTVTAPVDKTLAALERLGKAIDAAASGDGAGARPLGIHLEGPFISHARRGVHPPLDLLPPSLSMFDRFWQAAQGHIKVMTIAPELDGAAEVIAETAQRGVCVSLGHSDADLAETRSGVTAGARHATHTFNAMRPLNHRDPGILGEVLTNPKLTADIIADGIHLDPVVVNLFLRTKGPEAAVLITDAIAATGMPNGRYRLGTLEVDVKDGRCVANGTLAGSVLTMDRAVRNIMDFAGWDLPQTLRLATLNPARITGFGAKKGLLAPGFDADIVVLSAAGEVRQAIIRGAGI